MFAMLKCIENYMKLVRFNVDTWPNIMLLLKVDSLGEIRNMNRVTSCYASNNHYDLTSVVH